MQRLKVYVADKALPKPSSLPDDCPSGSKKAMNAQLGTITRHMSKEQLEEYCYRLRKEVPGWNRGHHADKISLALDVVRSVYTEVVFDCLCGEHMFALRWNEPCYVSCPGCKRKYDVRLSEKPQEKVILVKSSGTHNG